jgi:two-component system phosphate regulon response regulator OmpR
MALSETAAAGAGERAVDVQITRLRRKLEADPKQPIWIQTVRGEGYKLVAEPVFGDAD